MKNHSKEPKNVSKNDYYFTPEKCKNSIFHHYLGRQKAAWGIIMKDYGSPLSFRTSKEIKNNFNKKAKDNNMNKSQFLNYKILKEYKYVKQLQKINNAYVIIDKITLILSSIILDRNNKPFDEFDNDNVLKPFYKVKYLAGNAGFIFPDIKTKYDGSKTEHISVRLNHDAIKKLNYIAAFYNCKKSGIITLLLQNRKDTSIISSLSECFCYITDIKNYFCEKGIKDKNFEKEYNSLWKILS